MSLPNEMTPNAMTEFVMEAINNEIERMVEEEFASLAERVEKRKAEIVAGVLLHVKKEIDVQTLGQTLTFTIKNHI